MKKWPCKCFECVGDTSCDVCGAPTGTICFPDCSEHPSNRAPCQTMEAKLNLMQSCQGLLKIIDGIGGYTTPDEQFVIRQARQVIAKELSELTK